MMTASGCGLCGYVTTGADILFIQIGPATSGEPGNRTLSQLNRAIWSGEIQHVRSLELVFVGDVREVDTTGFDPRVTAAGTLALLLRNCKSLRSLTIVGYQAYYLSRSGRVWEASEPLLTELVEFPCGVAEDTPSVTSLSFRSCCLADGDIARIGPCFPQVTALTVYCCSGFKQSVYETYLMPYFERIEFENDDHWWPEKYEEGYHKNQAYYLGGPEWYPK